MPTLPMSVMVAMSPGREGASRRQVASSVWSQEGPGQVSAPPLTSCVTLDKSPLLSAPQFLL